MKKLLSSLIVVIIGVHGLKAETSMIDLYSMAVLPSIVANKPVANAGDDQTDIAIGETVMLDGSASSDPNDDTLTYAWSIKIKPEGSTAVISSMTEVSPTFITDTEGSYTLTLTVNDGYLNDTDSMMITVLSAPADSTLQKTGQTTSYTDFDDGYYQIGIEHSYLRDDVNEVVTDTITGLMWADDAWAQYRTGYLSEVTIYCDILELGIYNDWRVPTIYELRTLVDYGRSEPAINPEFVNTANYSYWSSTTSAGSTSSSWFISFTDGTELIGGNNYDRRVRCVRP